MKNICFNFQVHQPFRLKRYRFFDIGNDHYYFDDFQNEEIFKRITRETYMPANQMLLEMIKKSDGAVKVSFAISGTAISQFEIFAPELIDSFVELSKTGCVEFLAQPYAHSLSALGDPIEFRSQVEMHSRKIKMMFGQEPKVFRNTELIYSDEIATEVEEMGFSGIITEGAKHILGWKSPNYLYNSATPKGLPLFLRNQRFSDDILKNFSRYDWREYPLTADKFAGWLGQLPEDEEVVYIDMAYEVFGQAQPTTSGIFDFFRACRGFLMKKGSGLQLHRKLFVTVNLSGWCQSPLQSHGRRKRKIPALGWEMPFSRRLSENLLTGESELVSVKTEDYYKIGYICRAVITSCI